MAVSASLSASPSAPPHGAVLTVTYTVSGNDPVPPHQAVIAGRVSVGGVPFDVSTNVTIPGTPALPVTYEMPSCTGLTFTATADPAVFTAVIP